MKRSRRLEASSRLVVLAVGAALALAGCSATNPATITTPYPAADGTNAEITDPATGATLKLRNFLLVGVGKGKPGTLLGAVSNEGSRPVTISFTVLDQGQTVSTGSVTAAPGTLTQVGPSGTEVTVRSVPVEPGTVISLKAQTPAGGAQLSLPVVKGDDVYASVAPSAS